ncbi:MAG: hypothetical protein NW226_16275 [Microscillaceae bacterium]|nr:hypothetical protein [Microscillaceae bacterium]
MKKVLLHTVIFFLFASCQESLPPATKYAARVSGTPGTAFTGNSTAFKKTDTSRIFQDFQGNIPIDGAFMITFEEKIKGIEVLVQKTGSTGLLQLEVFINERKVDSASTSDPHGSLFLKVGKTEP